MRELRFKITGTAPLLTHNNQGANPLGRYAQAMKPLTGKRNKTDADVREISRLEWEASLYLKDGVVVLPAENLDRSLWDAAKRTKNGKKYKEGSMIADDFYPLAYRGPQIRIKENAKIPNPDLDKHYDQLKHMGMVKVHGSQVLRTRAIFHDWSLAFAINIDENVFDDRTIVSIIQAAGRYVGLCEKRPRLGRFEVEKT